MQMLNEYFNITKKEENKSLFKGLYISKQKKCKKYQGAYPVIFMTLKELKQDTWEKTYISLKELIK